MADLLFINPLLNIAIILPLLLLFMKERTRENYFRILSVILCYFICNLALTVQFHIDFLNIIGGNWNWDGKIYGIIWGIAAYFIFRNQFSENDFFTFRQNKDGLKPAIWAAVLVIGIPTLLGALNTKEFNLETLLFQITMPGFDEEIMFRGVLLGLMCSCLRNDGPIWRNPANLITSILFGLVHALNVDGGSVSFSISSLIWTGMIGYGLGYMTLKTRSILLAIVAHNLCNFLQNVVAMI